MISRFRREMSYDVPIKKIPRDLQSGGCRIALQKYTYKSVRITGLYRTTANDHVLCNRETCSACVNRSVYYSYLYRPVKTHVKHN